MEEPTCTEEGLEVQKCTVCNDIIEERTIAKVAHTYNEGEVIREADCVTGSETTFTCTVCGNEKVETGEPLGHVFGEWEVTKEATCTESGEEIRKCERCEETEVREILAKGHSFGEWTITKKPTTEEDGNCERICEVCDEKETKVIAKLPAEDKPEKPSTGEDDEKTEDTTPKTGDMSPIALSVFGMFAAVLLVCSSLVLKKKRR